MTAPVSPPRIPAVRRGAWPSAPSQRDLVLASLVLRPGPSRPPRGAR